MTPELKNGSQMRITDEEKQIIKSTFHGNDILLHTIFEFFLQELDANLLFGKAQQHPYGGINTENLTPAQVSLKVTARNDFLEHLKICLSQLWVLSETPFTVLEQVIPQTQRVQLIKAAFKGNESLLKLMRKIFYPEIDPNAPLEQVIDLYSIIDTESMTPEEVWIKMSARNEVIAYIEASLKQLNLIAEAKDTASAVNPQDSAK